MKKEKTHEEPDSKQLASLSSMNPMESRKKRKETDKEKRRLDSEKKEAEKSKNTTGETKNDKTGEPDSESLSLSNGLPEFHISVFKDLGSSNSAVREASAEALVTELKEVQKAYDGLEDKSLAENGLKLEAQKDDGLNQCAPSLRYAVRRLIRGVSSSRECARQGFALGLTLLVATFPSLKVDALMKLIVDLLEITSSMKGQDAKDCFLGRLFSYGAIARSGRLIEEWNSDQTTPIIKEFINVIVTLAARKRYLQQPAVSILLDFIEKLPQEALKTHVLEAPGLTEWFSGAIENPDALLLALKIREKDSIGTPVFGKLLPHPFCVNNFFSAEHLSSLSMCLKESTFCQPQVHSVWPVLVNLLSPESLLKTEDVISALSSSKKHKKSRKSSSPEEEIGKNLQCFVEVIIEGSLLPSSHDRKHLALNIVQLLLQRLPASFIPVVLSYKLVQCLVDILSTTKSWLHKVGQHFLSVLSDSVKEDDPKKVAVIVALQKHSNGKFDSITRTKTVKELMKDFDKVSGCKLFIQNLQDMFVDESQSSEEPSDQSQTTDDNSEMGSNEDKDPVGAAGNSDYLKTWIVESLPGILKSSKLDNDARFEIQKDILKFLAIQGIFTASLGTEVTSFELQEKFRWPKVATSTPLCKKCIEQLQLLLAIAQKLEVSRPLASSSEPPNNLGSYFMRFLSTLRNIPSISVFRPLEEDEENLIKKLQAMENFLSKEERNIGLSNDASRLHALRYLLIQLLLQLLYLPKGFSEATSQLIICCKKAYPAYDHLESSGEDENDDAAPAVMDVLVGTLLQLLPLSSAPMRTSIEQVFKYFCDDITDDGLLQMLLVIKKGLNSARRQVAESDSDDEESNEGVEDMINFEDDDDEVIDQDETGGEREEHTDDSEAVGEAEEAEKEEASEGSDDSDGGWDDDAMLQRDIGLAQLFKERKNLPGSDQHELVQFKLRVLSLLEIYLHENPGKAQVFVVYSNLVKALVILLNSKNSEKLSQKILVILHKKIFKAKEYPKGQDIELTTLESFLQKSLKLAGKQIKRKKLSGKEPPSMNRRKIISSRLKTISSLGQNSTFWILKIIDARSFSEPELQSVIVIFQGALDKYFDRKSNVKPGFLKEVFKRQAWIGRNLFNSLLEKCIATKSEHRRVEALDLVLEVMRPQEGFKELVESHVKQFSVLIGALVAKDDKKLRAKVKKFCVKIFQMMTTLNLAKLFLKSLDQSSQSVCESRFGDQFSNLVKLC